MTFTLRWMRVSRSIACVPAASGANRFSRPLLGKFEPRAINCDHIPHGAAGGFGIGIQHFDTGTRRIFPALHALWGLPFRTPSATTEAEIMPHAEPFSSHA